MIENIMNIMKKLSKQDIVKSKTISWTIKPDLMKSDNIFTIENIDISTDKNGLLKQIRSYNRINFPMKYFIFTRGIDTIYYVKNERHLPTIVEKIYNETALNYAYDNRE